MIVLIDGPLCVGKTTVAQVLAESLKQYDVKVMDADTEEYFELFSKDLHEGDPLLAPVRNHTTFCRNFGRLVEDEADEHEIVIVPMCLEGKAAKEKIADYLKLRREDVLHVVLMVDIETLKMRVENDNKESRDKRYALNEYDDCIRYIDMYYMKEFLINTEDLTAEEVANVILKKFYKVNG